MNKFYINIDNIIIPNELKGTVIIEALNMTDLKEKIIAYYGFNEENNKRIELWSGKLGMKNRIRLDILREIPKSCENIWIRGVLLK
jgi:hypothetical protein